jgi:selenocysteine lyase/cysteine desulfurase
MALQSPRSPVDYVLARGPDPRHNLADRAFDHRPRPLDATVLTPRAADERSGIVSARFPGRDGEVVAAELNARGIVVSPRFGSTRLSVHFFNDETDVDRALDRLEAVLAE